mmetsp:Transcript_59842/g.177344  ORF Transcript_59842/g.177344 Transcript_59842/m.177344 type:complete len:468 (+) Transcript_59842:194-1597(+)
MARTFESVRIIAIDTAIAGGGGVAVQFHRERSSHRLVIRGGEPRYRSVGERTDVILETVQRLPQYAIRVARRTILNVIESLLPLDLERRTKVTPRRLVSRETIPHPQRVEQFVGIVQILPSFHLHHPPDGLLVILLAPALPIRTDPSGHAAGERYAKVQISAHEGMMRDDARVVKPPRRLGTDVDPGVPRDAQIGHESRTRARQYLLEVAASSLVVILPLVSLEVGRQERESGVVPHGEYGDHAPLVRHDVPQSRIFGVHVAHSHSSRQFVPHENEQPHLAPLGSHVESISGPDPPGDGSFQFHRPQRPFRGIELPEFLLGPLEGRYGRQTAREDRPMRRRRRRAVGAALGSSPRSRDHDEGGEYQIPRPFGRLPDRPVRRVDVLPRLLGGLFGALPHEVEGILDALPYLPQRRFDPASSAGGDGRGRRPLVVLVLAVVIGKDRLVLRGEGGHRTVHAGRQSRLGRR